MFLENVTLEQLRAATKAQIVTFITNKLNSMTKRQIVLWLMNADVINIAPVVVRRPDGQLSSMTEVVRDMESDVQISKCVTDWSYYPTIEVDTITIKTYDGSNALIETRTIKHFTDGRQPMSTNG